MEHQTHISGRSNLRIYILITTLIIVGIFILTTRNGSGNGITSTVIKSLNGGDDNSSLTNLVKPRGVDFTEVPFNLIFNRIPLNDQDVQETNLEIQSLDLETKIKVNDDQLQLNNVGEVNLKLKGFTGRLKFDADTVTINGITAVFEVNGLVFSSSKGLDIEFEELGYNSLNSDNLALKEIRLEKGDGTLKVEEKLSYSLEQEILTVKNFQGNVNLTSGSSQSSIFEGKIDGLTVSGTSLNFNLD
ncbi:MAG TPA: hypothetical protein VJC39_03225 [Candidatus Nanoarchaeia archaeon]|nr:hypothetical protein [Candidatus Nanoarchaeia archaeon]